MTGDGLDPQVRVPSQAPELAAVIDAAQSDPWWAWVPFVFVLRREAREVKRG